MDWLFRHRWSTAGALVVALALCGALAVWARAAPGVEGSVRASGTSPATPDPADADPAEPGVPTAPAPTTTSTTAAAPTTTAASGPTTTAAPTTPAPTTTEPAGTSGGAASPTSPPETRSTRSAPAFAASIAPVTAEELGPSWTPGRGCTPPERLRRVTVTHWDYDGRTRTGELIVAAGQARDVAAIFADIYAAGFPIERMVPVSEYDADDRASMRANNTSGYNCRTMAGSATLSNHAYGRAVDVNPLHNPYVRAASVDPPEAAPWADRSRDGPGMIHPGDAVVRAFTSRGWDWGGDWNSPDYQHFDR